MREIKFRGKQKQWVYGGVSVFRDTATIFDYGCIANSAYEVDIKTIGQFTGLTDKNGDEIYEGDIISCNCKYVPFRLNEVEVVFYENGFNIKAKQINEVLPIYALTDIQITGNIHE